MAENRFPPYSVYFPLLGSISETERLLDELERAYFLNIILVASTNRSVFLISSDISLKGRQLDSKKPPDLSIFLKTNF